MGKKTATAAKGAAKLPKENKAVVNKDAGTVADKQPGFVPDHPASDTPTANIQQQVLNTILNAVQAAAFGADGDKPGGDFTPDTPAPAEITDTQTGSNKTINININKLIDKVVVNDEGLHRFNLEAGKQPIDNVPEEIDPELLELLAAYFSAYPNEKVFHVASDGQVFLDANKRDAQAHEKNMGGKLRSYQVN